MLGVRVRVRGWAVGGCVLNAEASGAGRVDWRGSSANAQPAGRERSLAPREMQDSLGLACFAPPRERRPVLPLASC